MDVENKPIKLGRRPVASQFGARLAALRERKGARLTQEEAADAIGISRGHLANLERGRGSASLDVLQAIADYYGTNIIYLKSGEGNPDAITVSDPREVEVIKAMRGIPNYSERKALL